MLTHTAQNIRQIQGATQWWVAPALLSLFACLCSLPGIAELCQYQRDTIIGGELWRVFTSHFTHWSLEHFIWDLIVFICLASVVARLNKKALVPGIIIMTLGITITLLLLTPEISYYRGLSGLDSGLFCMIATTIYKQARSRSDKYLASIALTLFLGKTIYEILTQATLFVSSMGDHIIAMPLAHLSGGAIGVFFILFTTPKTPK